jgi:hypothetical protein
MNNNQQDGTPPSIDTPLSLVGVLIVGVLTALITLLTTLASTTGALNHMERASPILTSLVFSLATVAIGLTAFGSYFTSLVKQIPDPNAQLSSADKSPADYELPANAAGGSLADPWQWAWKAKSARMAAAANALRAAAHSGQPEAVPFSREARKNATNAAEYAGKVSSFLEAAAEAPDQPGKANDAIAGNELRIVAFRESKLAELWAENARMSALAAPPRQPGIDRPKLNNIPKVLLQVVRWIYNLILYPLRALVRLWRRADWQGIATICFRYGLLLFVTALIGGAVLAGWSATTLEAPTLALSQNTSAGAISGSAHAYGMRPQDDLVVCLISEPAHQVVYADASGSDMAGSAADSFSIPNTALNKASTLTALAFDYNSKNASASNLCARFTHLDESKYSSVTLRLSPSLP